MPKVDTMGITISGETLQLRIYFNTKHSFHIHKDDWPNKVRNTVGLPGSWPEIDSLKAKVQFLIKKYHEEMSATDMVILYSVGAGASLVWERHSINSAGRVGRFPDIATCKTADASMDETGLTIDYIVCLRKKADKTYYKEVFLDEEYNITDSGTWWSDNDKYRVMEFTPERLQFFKDTTARLKELVEAVLKFFDTNTDVVAKIDAGGFRLPLKTIDWQNH